MDSSVCCCLHVSRVVAAPRAHARSARPDLARLPRVRREVCRAVDAARADALAARNMLPAKEVRAEGVTARQDHADIYGAMPRKRAYARSAMLYSRHSRRRLRCLLPRHYYYDYRLITAVIVD